MVIDGVEIKEMVVHSDERGFFTELIRHTDGIFQNVSFEQLSHSRAEKGILKAWHLHQKQTDFMYVVTGDIHLGLHDLRKDSPSYQKSQTIWMGESFGRKVVRIPPGVAHGYKIVNGPMDIVYLMDRVYDPEDIFYHDADDPNIGYDWNKDKHS